MKSKTKHIDGSSSDPKIEEFHIWGLVENDICKNKKQIKKKHNSESISQSKNKTLMKSKTQHVDDD